MNDTHTIEAAYERLTTSLNPPTDADRLVAARLTSRRRHRRTAQGAVATVAVVATLGGVALVGGGSPTSAPQRSTPYADATSAPDPSGATDPVPPVEPTDSATVDLPTISDLCDLTADEALRLIRQRYVDGDVEISRSQDDGILITLADLRKLKQDEDYALRIVARCR